MPVWLKTILATAALATAAWALNDRIHLGERLTAVETYIKESINRLDRIERKLDELKENQ